MTRLPAKGPVDAKGQDDLNTPIGWMLGSEV